MKKLLLATLTIFSFSLANAQDTWTRSETDGFGNNYDEFITCMQSFKGQLYAGSADYSGGLFTTPTGNLGSWTPALTSPNIRKINELGVTAEGIGYMYC